MGPTSATSGPSGQLKCRSVLKIKYIAIAWEFLQGTVGNFDKICANSKKIHNSLVLVISSFLCKNNSNFVKVYHFLNDLSLGKKLRKLNFVFIYFFEIGEFSSLLFREISFVQFK